MDVARQQFVGLAQLILKRSAGVSLTAQLRSCCYLAVVFLSRAAFRLAIIGVLLLSLTVTAFSLQERAGQNQSNFDSNVSIPVTCMAKGLGSFGGATLERSKLDTHKEVKTQEPRVDNSGGGGNNGKNIFNGGGGDGDDGDDDDYFDEFGDGDGDGDSDDFFRTVVQQLYTKEAIDAVLQEWFRTVADLPAIIRQSVSMGLFSSAQLVRFLSMDVRPNVTRAVTRTMPPAVRLGRVSFSSMCLLFWFPAVQAFHFSKMYSTYNFAVKPFCC